MIEKAHTLFWYEILEIQFYFGFLVYLIEFFCFLYLFRKHKQKFSFGLALGWVVISLFCSYLCLDYIPMTDSIFWATVLNLQAMIGSLVAFALATIIQLIWKTIKKFNHRPNEWK